MVRTNRKKEEAKGKRQFSQEQYERLKHCSEESDMTEWNQWREEHPKKEILLEGTRFRDAYLVGANLRSAKLIGADLTEAKLNRADLSGADLSDANLFYAHLSDAKLSNAVLNRANLNDSFLDKANLRGTKLREAHLKRANLSEADLSNADISKGNLGKANLRGACLCEADLSGATFRAADLRQANLCEADLQQADLFLTELNEANLHGTKLCQADIRRAVLIRTDLSAANLLSANLFEAQLREANLKGANLTEADLRLSRLIKCDLADCVLDNAIVEDIQIHELRSLPRTPRILRIDCEGERILTDHETETFFVMSAIVEVYLTDRLSQRELACFNLHMAEMQDSGVGNDVFLTGHKYHDKGSVLRFHGQKYADIYDIIPDLLAPFRMARAIDWEKFFKSISMDERDEAITALARLETKTRKGKWRFAERMADFFQSYAKARVYQISEERRRGVRIDVYTDEGMADRLSRVALPSDYDGTAPLIIQTGRNPTIQTVEKIDMINVKIDGNGNIVASGTDASVTARDITILKESVDRAAIPEADIKEKLKEACEELQKLKFTDDHKDKVIECLGALVKELVEPQRKPGRIKELWSRINTVAQPVAAILSTAASLAEMLN
jgi:uncharacterized protein YjbI with pentapeptide repeats